MPYWAGPSRKKKNLREERAGKRGRKGKKGESRLQPPLRFSREKGKSSEDVVKRKKEGGGGGRGER